MQGHRANRQTRAWHPSRKATWARYLIVPTQSLMSYERIILCQGSFCRNPTYRYNGALVAGCAAPADAYPFPWPTGFSPTHRSSTASDAN